MSVKLTIMSQMQQIAEEQGKKLAPLSDELVLLDSGLDSLGFAILVARLEDSLGCRPVHCLRRRLLSRDSRRLRQGL